MQLQSNYSEILELQKPKIGNVAKRISGFVIWRLIGG